MGRHILKDGIVKNGNDVLDGVRQVEITETVAETDTSAMGDGWMSHTTGLRGWEGSISMLLDHDAAANQTLRAGDTITFEMYSEGDASGMTFYSGAATVLEHKVGGGHDTEGTREYSIKGQGPLSIATVA